MTTIVCIGDSITYGQLLIPPHRPWPRLLTGYEVFPAGVPSDTTRLGLERFPVEVQQRAPDGVVIQFGHNDANQWVSDRGLPRVSSMAYRANLVEMIERCRVFGAIPMVCSLTPSRRSEDHAIWVFRYNGILIEMAAATGVEIIDVRAAFGDNYDLLMEDGLHLSVDGHRLYAAVVQEALDRVFHA